MFKYSFGCAYSGSVVNKWINNEIYFCRIEKKTVKQNHKRIANETEKDKTASGLVYTYYEFKIKR